MKCPVGVVGDTLCNLYVTDCGNGRVLKLHYDSVNEEIEYVASFTIGEEGSVWDVDYHDTCLYVTNPKDHMIYKLAVSGKPLIAYGQLGSSIGEFLQPGGIAVHNNYIYVNDRGNNRIVQLEDKGDYFEWKHCRYLTSWDNVQLHGIETDKDGFVYTIDSYNCHILQFSPDLSNLLQIFGSEGTGTNQFRNPRFITIDEDNSAIITEQWTNTLRRFHRKH
jgi:DNA-binding beta-propeller fold protein YncE